MSYLGIYTNNLNDNDISEIKKADTIAELEAKKTNKQFLKVYEMQEDILEDAELICTKVLKWGASRCRKNEIKTQRKRNQKTT